jgi:hypothetical protein
MVWLLSKNAQNLHTSDRRREIVQRLKTRIATDSLTRALAAIHRVANANVNRKQQMVDQNFQAL